MGQNECCGEHEGPISKGEFSLPLDGMLAHEHKHEESTAYHDPTFLLDSSAARILDLFPKAEPYTLQHP
jgi:hypothetical protein